MDGSILIYMYHAAASYPQMFQQEVKKGYIEPSIHNILFMEYALFTYKVKQVQDFRGGLSGLANA